MHAGQKAGWRRRRKSTRARAGFPHPAYHKPYKDYYVTKSEELNGTGPKIAEAGKNGRRSDRHR